MDGQNFNNEQNPYQDNITTPANKPDALAIVSLVAGILSIVLVCCTMYWAIIPAIVGIVCAVMSKKNNGKTGIATAGLICSIVGIVLAVIWTIIGVGALALVGMSEYSELLNQ